MSDFEVKSQFIYAVRKAQWSSFLWCTQRGHRLSVCSECDWSQWKSSVGASHTEEFGP